MSSISQKKTRSIRDPFKTKIFLEFAMYCLTIDVESAGAKMLCYKIVMLLHFMLFFMKNCRRPLLWALGPSTLLLCSSLLDHLLIPLSPYPTDRAICYTSVMKSISMKEMATVASLF